MAVRTTGNIKNGASPAVYMQNFLRKQVLENLEPELYFAKYGQVSKAENGYLTLSWARFDQLTRTVAQVTLTEGVTPTEVDATVTVVQATPVQYGMQVIISDFLQKTSPISSILELVGREVAANMMRVIDKVIQAELITNGTNVIYANGRANRAALIAGDVVTGADISKVAIKLRKQNAKTISEGCYVGIVDNFVAGDIRNTSSGLWLDANKYVTNGAILNGETGKLQGIKIVETSNIDTVATGITVYPSYFIGKDAYGIANWQNMETIFHPIGSAGSADPLNQRATVGAKIAFAAKMLQQNALVRLESAATSV